MSDSGEPAFPQLELDRISGQTVDQHFGITMRDYFAAKAMAAIITMPDGCTEGYEETSVAFSAYQMADAMIAERAK